MNNQNQASPTTIVGQSGAISQVSPLHVENQSESTARFAKRFTASQRAKGHDLGPLFGVLDGIAGTTPQPTQTPAPISGLPACRTVQEIMKENQTKREARQPAPVPVQSPADRYADHMPPLIRAQREYRFNVSETLTACLDTADCPDLARRIFRLLHELAILSLRARGLKAERATVAAFHLPLELLAAHFQVDRTTIWRNLQPLISAGIIDTRDHYDKLKGRTAVTGKIWAVSLRPESQLEEGNNKVQLRHDDLTAPWRNLDADTDAGRTVWNLTRTDEQKAAYKLKQKEKEAEIAEAQARATLRAKERRAAKARGEKPLTGRKAATENAAKTRAEKPRAKQPKSKVQQSTNGLKVVEKQELIKWVLDGFTNSSDVTLTVAQAFSDGLDVIFTLPSLAGLSRQRRNAEVEKTARALAAQFEDTANTRFWCWLIWQLIRADDQGQRYMDDVAHILARVYHDIKHDESMYSRAQKKPAALVVKELKACGIYNALKLIEPTRAGARPKHQA